MRSRPVSSGKEPSEAQTIHRARFTMLVPVSQSDQRPGAGLASRNTITGQRL